ncbi:MAG: Uma2 family endonuclease [Acidimicrobiales bacterium]
MAEEAVATELPIEAPDMTATEAHVRTVAMLRAALTHALRGVAGVFGEMFLRVDDRVQVSPDVFAVPGVTTGDRTVYRVPAEPVPSVTIEVLSPKNRTRSGRAELEAKRALFGRIGVPLHVEVDREEGFIAVWELRDDTLVRTDLRVDYTSEAIGRVRIATPAPGVLRVTLADGHEVLDVGDELTRAEREAARAEREAARAEREAARAEGLAVRLRALGIDPDE